MTLAETFAPLVDLLYPPRCPLCGEGIHAQTGLCASCWGNLVLPAEPSCALCSRPFAEPVGPGAVCAPCLAEPPRHDGIAAATLYNDTSRQLVLKLKHGNKIALAALMARPMRARLPFLDSDWVVVPVPLHRWRLWQRGYNQAAELARHIARPSGARLVVDGLQRIKRTPSLGGLGKAARKRALSGAISVHPSRKGVLHGRDVILVDDVYTSGATTAACVAALKKAGAKRVVISCFARVLDEALNAT